MPDLVLHYTVNAFSIQTFMAVGQLVGVMSISHFTCFCTQPYQITQRGIKITAPFDHLHMHAALSISAQCLLHPATGFF